MSEIFDKYAQYYDLFYEDKNYRKEAEYIAKLIREFSPQAKTVLELGCGTGKHAKLLEQKGYEIFGIDLSDTMLAQAKALGVNCARGDVRTFRANKKFDAVISLFHVASYQTSNEDILDYFKTASVHLEKGGKFIFDVWYKPAVLKQIPEKRTKILENNKVKITRYCVPEHIKEKDIVKVNYHIEIEDKLTPQRDMIDETHTMRYFSIDDIISFAEQSGFKYIKSEEWLTGNDPSFETWSVSFIWIKE